MVSIPSGLFTQYYETIDEIYSNGIITPTVKLYYIQKENCPNCVPGHPNKYKTGGPIEFTFGACPYCDGRNFIENNSTEDIKLRVYNQKKDFIKIASNVEVTDGLMQIIGQISNMPKVKRANYMLLYSDTGYGDWKYKLVGEPLPFGFGSSQFVSYIEAI